MKKYLFSLAVAALSLGFSACDGSQEEPHIQWFPVVTLDGEDTYYVELGEDFIIPGFTAINTLTGEDASNRVVVRIYDSINGVYVDELDTSSPGVFQVQYIPLASEVQVSSDYEVFLTRTIYVYDPSVTITLEGTWTLNMKQSYELYEGETYYLIDDYGDVNSKVSISQILPGFFSDGDLLGGIYSTVIDMDNRYSSYLTTYGPNCFKLTGFLSMDNEGKVSLLSWERYSGFFNGLSISNAFYDDSTGTFSYNASLTWDPFGGEPDYYIVLEKEQE